MTACKEKGNSGVAPIIELLCAHAALVQNTSDHMGLTLGEGVSELQDISSSLPQDARAQFDQCLSRMMVAMQSQDILRQQIGVLMHGLKTLCGAEAPAADNQDASDWVATRIEDLRAAYVMREQYVLHETLTGRPAPPEADPGPVLFD